VKTVKEITNKDGVTLGQLIEFAAECSAAGMPNAAVVSAHIGRRCRIRTLTIETEESH
jgi:hypothetical protein